eukprot:scaffold106430_cov21-Tisochrysis_lutea.AAC.1
MHPAPSLHGHNMPVQCRPPHLARQGCCCAAPAKGGPGPALLHGSPPLAAQLTHQAGPTGTPESTG